MKRYGVGSKLRMVKKREYPGFTIVELLIVIVVIAILAAITIVSYSGIRGSAQTSAYRAELSQLLREMQTDILTTTGLTVDVKSPIASATGLGTKQLVEPLQSAQQITLYGVFDTPNNPAGASWTGMVSMSPHGTNNAFRLRTGASGDNSARGFYATSAQTNRDITKNNVLNTTARHVGWIAANETSIYSSYDGQVDGSVTLTTHDGWNFDSVVLSSSSAFTAVAALVFNEYHDSETRTKIVQWLSEKYAAAP